MLNLSPDLQLPVDAVTQKLAFLAQSGAGKSYAAMKLVEEMLGVGAQVVVLDPTGVWYGLRVGADGTSPGFPITIFGGEHGDLTLSPDAGGVLAAALVERRISAVLDLSDMTTEETIRFSVAFADAFFQRKKRAKSPVHLVLEEAQTFCPQCPEPPERVMLNRFERLLKLGRNFGVGWSLVSQQPQAVNKRCLNQAGCLVALRTIGTHERKAIKSWVSDKATDQAELDLVGSLPSLETGEAFIWSPGWLRLTKRIHIGRKRTFDSSATPEVGAEALEPQVLAPVELEALRAALAETIEEAEGEDPRALRRRIAELERQLAAAPPPETEEVPVIRDDQVQALAELAGRLRATVSEAVEGLRGFTDALGHVQQAQRNLTSAVVRDTGPPLALSVPTPEPPTRRIERAPTPARASAPLRATSPVPTGAPTIKRGARAMLVALATRYPIPLTRHQVATLAGMSPTSGTFTDYLSTLRRARYIEEPRGKIELTEAGIAYLGPARPHAPPTTAELVALWRPRLKAGARRMLEVLVACYPQSIPRAQLGEQADIVSTSGTFGDYLSTLRRNGLSEDVADVGVRASSTLFP